MSGSLILGAALGDCVHVAGVLNFLAAARRIGHRTEFLGPAVAVDRLVAETQRRRPALLAVSYRLTPEAARLLLRELATALDGAGLAGTRMVFGGPPPVAAVASESRLFEAVFGSPAGPDVEEWLSGKAKAVADPGGLGRDLMARRQRVSPQPLLRHHFGLPDLKRTVDGIATIARSGVLDVISIGPDQNAQEHFFHPERMSRAQDGAGGVPVRSPEDFHRLSVAAQAGNHPLLRCYSGTNDLVALAELLRDTIDNAWCAVPVFWYSELDGRSERSLEEAIFENHLLVEWCAANGTPVERNDQNQWGLRAAHDVLQIATAALAAHLTARAGVKTYVLQMMLNTPAGISPAMDIAKMHAMATVVERMVGPEVTVLRQLRAGLFSLPPEPDRALGQLAASTSTAMALAPDIVHVVGHSEGDHAIEADELVTACAVVHQLIDDALLGLPDPLADPVVRARVELLIEEADYLVDSVGRSHPGALRGDPTELAALVRSGVLDAPHLSGSRVAPGTVITVVDGGCNAVDPATGNRMSEKERLAALGV